MRRLLAVVLLMLTGQAFAQQGPAPVLETVFEETQAIPGQPLTLRLTILVPTFMPNPPVWPSFEAPNLLVRLPGRATSPTSRTVDGETWSGISRRYSISPMIPGQFTLPAQEIAVTFADPETNEPVVATVSTGAITLTGVIPEGAEGLDPFIAAQSLDLTQEIDGTPETMVAGDSVTRRVVASVRGVSPMFLPALLPVSEINGVAAYPNEPVVEEKDERGTVTGKRTESVTYVAEGGGGGKSPAVTLDWYNLETGAVETATLDGFAVSVEGPPAVRTTTEPRNWRAIAIASALGLLALTLVCVVLRRLTPLVVEIVRSARSAWLASEHHAHGEVRKAARGRDLAALLPALDEWAGRVNDADPRQSNALKSALHAIGASRYGRGATATDAAGWNALQSALATARREASRSRQHSYGLRPLNPG